MSKIKKDKKSLIIWATVALVIGVVIGLIITNLTTTGQAKLAITEKKFREANVSIDDQKLTLCQWIDNVGGYNDKYYFYWQYETITGNWPATVDKFTQINVNDFTLSNFNHKLKLKLLNGEYSTTGYNILQIPFYHNNLTVNSIIEGHFELENGSTITKHNEKLANPNGYEFAEVTNFDFDCSGSYIMEHTGTPTDYLEHVLFELVIYDPVSNNHWLFYWDVVVPPIRYNYSYVGDFPSEAINILENGSDYDVNLRATIFLNSQNETLANTYKQMNCQTGKEKSLTSEQLEILKEKSGNTPEAIAEQLFKKTELSKIK